MGYFIDLCRLSLDQYKQVIKNQYLLPKRKILQENIDSCFDAIKKCSIDNVK